MTIPRLTQRHLTALSDAIHEANAWRGALMPEDFAEFDKRIKVMREALKLIRAYHKQKDTCEYTRTAVDSYGATWTTACQHKVECVTPDSIGFSFPPLPNASGKFCHFCGKEIKLKTKE